MAFLSEKARSNILSELGLEQAPKGCIFLFQGPSGSGKTITADNMLVEHLALGLRAAVLTLDRPPVGVLYSLEQKGWLGSHNVIIIDGYSWLTCNAPQDENALSDLSHLPEISILAAKTLSAMGEGSLFVFDSLSAILCYNEEAHVVRLLQTLAARIREAREWAVMTLESGIHTQSFYNAVRLLVDCVVDFKIDDVEGTLQKSIRVYRSRFPNSGTMWHPLNITAQGTIDILPAINMEVIRNET